MTCLLVLSISYLLDAHRSKRRRDFIVGGLIGGLAAATKYSALLLAVPLAASYLLNIVDAPDRRKALLDPRLLLFGLPFLAAFAIGVPFLLFDRQRFFAQIGLLQQSMEMGDQGLDLGLGWIYHVQYSLRYGIGLPMLVASVIGMGMLLWEQPRVGLLFLSFPIAYFLVAGSVRNLFFRYAIPLVPFLSVTAARAVTWLAGKLWALLARDRRSPIRPYARYALTAALALAVVTPSAVSTYQFDRIAGNTDNRVVVARWFDAHVPAGSSVLMSGSKYGYVQFTREKNYNAWLWDRDRLIFVPDKHPEVGRPEYILLQESPLPSETQPVVTDYLKGDYQLVERFQAFSPDDARVYDVQDAFFIPFHGFHGVERPGPNYTLYKRGSSAP